jgi:hypothetical protein
MSDTERLLQASIEIIEKDRRIAQLEAQVERMRYQVGRANLLADLLAQAAQFDMETQ